MFDPKASIFLSVECFSESVHINVHSLNHVEKINAMLKRENYPREMNWVFQNLF